MTIPQNIQQLSQKLMLALKTIPKLFITVTGNHINYTQTEVVTNLVPNSRKYHPYKKNTRSYTGIYLPKLLKLALRENLMLTPISILSNATIQQKLQLCLNKENTKYPPIYRYFHIGKTLYKQKLELTTANLTKEAIQKQLHNEFKTTAGLTNSHYRLRAALRLYDLFYTSQQVQIIEDNLKINSVTGGSTTSRKREFTANKYQQHYKKETKKTSSNTVYDHLFQVGTGSLSVYMDGSLRSLGTVGCKTGTAVFFEDINSGLAIEVLSLMLSTLAEMQTIVLVLEYVSLSSSVYLFLNSQSALDAYKSELVLACPNFCNQYWIECWHIVNIIHSKNLSVSWHKVKSHSDIPGNDHADSFADDMSIFDWFFFSRLSKHFLVAKNSIISGNSRHFVYDVYYSVCCVYWEIGSGSKFLPHDLTSKIDWHHFLLV
ncbi:hypothetical protein G9A89_000751 [Geosiphon pyriformis]|nr:hypothetical protein G9A89_000751 [Geosiphon pyriformis]